MFPRITFIIILVALTGSHYAYAAEKRVVDVYDGDTLQVDIQGKKAMIRLYGIDAPENGQHGNVYSTRFLRRIILEHSVEIKVIATDLFAQPQAIVMRVGKESSVNAAMVANGYAWVNPAQCEAADCKVWRKLESHARKLKLGIWSGYNLEPPWEFKKRQQQR